MNNNFTKSAYSFVNDDSLAKKIIYNKKISDSLATLHLFVENPKKYPKSSRCSNENLTPTRNPTIIKKKGFIVFYSIYFLFSATNTFLYVLNAKGLPIFSITSGLLGFKGKSKKSRFQILKLFLRELEKLKIRTLKTKPVAVILKNTGTHKKFIVKNLKKKFVVKFVKNYQSHSYNGCRSKKKVRK